MHDTNHLAGQSSPYLALHAEDPVAWYPWGPEALVRARELDRPLFLSIGYASCHWCHVMQRESFRDTETAEELARRVVSVKVDRELRPDVDHLFMTYVTLASGHGGWPMSVFTTPEGAPFFGGTYFPKRAHGRAASFMQVVEAVTDAYAADRAQVEGVGEEALEMVARVMRPQPERPVTPALLDRAVEAIGEMEEPRFGGLGPEPKFPQAPVVQFLLAYARETGDEQALGMARRWLLGMLRGGIYDQAGGGLFRYSVDAEWLVPHFEKMLYDNGLLLSTLAQLHALDPSDEVAHTIRSTAAFLARDLAAPGGGCFSSLDAEAGGVEGDTYVWSWEELAEALDGGQLELARTHLGASEAGNWTAGSTILTRREGRGTAAPEVDEVLRRLHTARAGRPQPAVVTNLLTEWNALAARGLIEGGLAIGDDDVVRQGLDLVDWLVEHALEGSDVVHAIGEPSTEGVRLVEDYASMAMALTVAAAAGDDRSLRGRADAALERALELFAVEVPDAGTWLYMTTADTDLPIRPLAYDDAPTPSGAATLAEAFSVLNHDDRAGLLRLVAPATGIVNRAPYMAGTWLRVMIGAAEEL